MINMDALYDILAIIENEQHAMKSITSKKCILLSTTAFMDRESS
jgi:hypothetical protein